MTFWHSTRSYRQWFDRYLRGLGTKEPPVHTSRTGGRIFYEEEAIDLDERVSRRTPMSSAEENVESAWLFAADLRQGAASLPAVSFAARHSANQYMHCRT